MNPTNAQKVCHFHQAINGRAMPTTPTLPTPQLLQLRQKLIQEEYEECQQAIQQLAQTLPTADPLDITPLIHELTDLLYVTYGAILTLGADADAVFEEIHAANMRKLNGPRRADGKQLKPPNWQPANVRGILAQQHEKP